MQPPEPDSRAPELSVVVPVFRCTPCLLALHDRLARALADRVRDFELILVDDRGGEGAWTRICELARADERIRGLRLTRNVGQDMAIAAGVAHSRGDWVVVMDCDLQDPPEVVPTLLEAARSGVDVVYASRERKPASPVRRALAAAYFRTLAARTRSGIRGQYGPFSIVSRRAATALSSPPQRAEHYVLSLHRLGLPSAVIEYRPSGRHAGESSYTLARLFRNGVSVLVPHSTLLPRRFMYVGSALALSGGLLMRIRPSPTSPRVLAVTGGGMLVAGISAARAVRSQHLPTYSVEATTQGPAHTLR